MPVKKDKMKLQKPHKLVFYAVDFDWCVPWHFFSAQRESFSATSWQRQKTRLRKNRSLPNLWRAWIRTRARVSAHSSPKSRNHACIPHPKSEKSWKRACVSHHKVEISWKRACVSTLKAPGSMKTRNVFKLCFHFHDDNPYLQCVSFTDWEPRVFPPRNSKMGWKRVFVWIFEPGRIRKRVCVSIREAGQIRKRVCV